MRMANGNSGANLAIKPKRFSWGLLAAFTLCLFCPTGQAYSENAPGQISASRSATTAEPDQSLLKELQNPVADLISVPISNQTNFNIGPNHRVQSGIELQPVIPVNLTEKWMLVTRAIIPIKQTPYPDQKTGGQFGLGDISPSFFLVPRKPGSVIWGAGPALAIPTATGSMLGLGKFGIGPSAVVLTQPGPWTIGALVSNVWSVAGSGGRPSVNRMTLQYFLAYSLKRDWYITAAPNLAADWRAPRSDRWLVPVGGGVGKLVMFGARPVDFAATFYRNVVTPSGMPTWQMNFQMTLLFPKGK